MMKNNERQYSRKEETVEDIRERKTKGGVERESIREIDGIYSKCKSIE